MKCTHQVSDKGSNIIWTSTDTGGSKDVPDGRRRPEAHAFERFGIICTCNKSRHIKKTYPHLPLPLLGKTIVLL
jgi:hypothetical protein